MEKWITVALGSLLVTAAGEETGTDSPAAQHWAFQPVEPAAAPAVKDESRVQNPIDRFVFAKLEAGGLKPAPQAEDRVLLRRVHLDLTGLPPTPEEQRAFAESPDLDAVIDDLLSRTAYGERWARHWLDVARYADTNGYERDEIKPYVWRYRDYVIDAFNADKPYDRFIIEQLAGDELPDANAETMIATGYLRLGHWDDEPADFPTDRFDQLDDILNTISQGMLGLTLACARCHDHKFEPLSQKDYYALVAVFDPLKRPQKGRTELALPVGTRAEVAALKPGEGTLAYIWEEPSNVPPVTHLLVRGQPGQPGDAVLPDSPEILTPRAAFPQPDEDTTQRRLGLANWIASPENPLTARVIVNRVWKHHFGEGLVRTPNDFGVMGERPTHSELLDWLSNWFVHEADWSLKKLDRLILASSCWRMSARGPGAEDPENRLLSHQNYRRLEVEAIRDSILAVSGQLNREMYGPHTYPSVSPQALEGHSDPEKIWKPFDEKSASRRTIYAFVKRSLMLPMLEMLDLCDTTQPSAGRRVTTVAPQALTLYNGVI